MGGSWWIYIVIGVILVAMILLTIIPQKKRQKQQQEMMNSLTVGTKIMTIGRLVGKITQVNADNTLYVNVGTERHPRRRTCQGRTRAGRDLRRSEGQQ